MLVLREPVLKKGSKLDFAVKFTGELVCTVRVGDIINPDSTVFEGRMTKIAQSLNLCRQLGVQSMDAKKYVKRSEGEIVSEGDLIAKKSVASGVAERVVKAKSDGRISLKRLEHGFVDIMSPFTEASVTAGVNGTVKSIIPAAGLDREIVFAVDGWVSQPKIILPYKNRGIFGSSAKLEIIKDGNSIYRPNDVLSTYADKIVVTGRRMTLGLYEALLEAGVVGIICGGVPVEEFNAIGASSVPVFITEGWGTIPINKILLDMLEKQKNKVVYMDTSNKQLVIYDGKEEDKKRQLNYVAGMSSLEVGDIVQILDFPYWGYSGEVGAILDQEEMCVVKVAGSGQKVTVGSKSIVKIS